MKCKKCGFETPNNSNFCAHCGTSIDLDDVFINKDNSSYYSEVEEEKEERPKENNRYEEQDLRTYVERASIGWFFLGLVFPILGFILGAVYRYRKPDMAAKLRTGAIYGLFIELVGVFIRIMLNL